MPDSNNEDTRSQSKQYQDKVRKQPERVPPRRSKRRKLLPQQPTQYRLNATTIPSQYPRDIAPSRAAMNYFIPMEWDNFIRQKTELTAERNAVFNERIYEFINNKLADFDFTNRTPDEFKTFLIHLSDEAYQHIYQLHNASQRGHKVQVFMYLIEKILTDAPAKNQSAFLDVLINKGIVRAEHWQQSLVQSNLSVFARLTDLFCRKEFSTDVLQRLAAIVINLSYFVGGNNKNNQQFLTFVERIQEHPMRQKIIQCFTDLQGCYLENLPMNRIEIYRVFANFLTYVLESPLDALSHSSVLIAVMTLKAYDQSTRQSISATTLKRRLEDLAQSQQQKSALYFYQHPDWNTSDETDKIILSIAAQIDMQHLLTHPTILAMPAKSLVKLIKKLDKPLPLDADSTGVFYIKMLCYFVKEEQTKQEFMQLLIKTLNASPIEQAVNFLLNFAQNRQRTYAELLLLPQHPDFLLQHMLCEILCKLSKQCIESITPELLQNILNKFIFTQNSSVASYGHTVNLARFFKYLPKERFFEQCTRWGQTYSVASALITQFQLDPDLTVSNSMLKFSPKSEALLAVLVSKIGSEDTIKIYQSIYSNNPANQGFLSRIVTHITQGSPETSNNEIPVTPEDSTQEISKSYLHMFS